MVLILSKPSCFESHQNLNKYISLLPKNYLFELPKTINNILKLKAKKVALQFPDGLLKYSNIICDALRNSTGVEVIILGDVVYGACCVNDIIAEELGCDLLIHYGHSCLLPINSCRIKCIYVFVGILFDTSHCLKMIQKVAEECYNNDSLQSKVVDHSDDTCNTIDLTMPFENNKYTHIKKDYDQHCKDCSENNVKIDELTTNESKKTDDNKFISDELISDYVLSDYISSNIAILGTIQFNSAVASINNKLNIKSAQIKPLSPGETLGCTSPRLNKKICIYISDGRFHLESLMIQNPTLKYYKYCPFSKKMSREFYDFSKMIQERREEKHRAFRGKNFGVILGTLGRQGNPKIFNNIVKKLKDYKVYKIMLKEINTNLNSDFSFIDAFVQVGCPRLSIDWGKGFGKPLLNPYEIFNDLNEYEMDYYSREKNNEWNNC